VTRRTAIAPAVACWLGLLLFAVYLLSFSGRFHVMDELAVFTAGYNVAGHGQADINPLIWTNHWTPNPPGIWGQDNQLYTKKAPGISWLAAPLIWLGLRLPGLNAVYVGLLLNSLVTAATGALLLRWLADLGFSRRTALLTALAYGLGTIAWVYARMFWESSLLALFFLVALWAAWRATHPAGREMSWRWALLSGGAAAIGVTLRFEAAVAAGLVGLYLLLTPVAAENSAPSGEAGGSLRSRWGRALLFAAPLLLVGVGLLAFNAVRFGSLGETGYSQEIRFEAPWIGGYGLLFSPGRGLFLFSPLLLLLFFGLYPALKKAAPRLLLAGQRSVPLLLALLWLVVCLGRHLGLGAAFFAAHPAAVDALRRAAAGLGL
jgi:4-amino-4-deoxy-L-arabinose transferase-like glycosyltransferase